MNRLQLFNLYRAAGNSPCQAYRLASGALEAERGDGLVLWACAVALATLSVLMLLGVV